MRPLLLALLLAAIAGVTILARSYWHGTDLPGRNAGNNAAAAPPETASTDRAPGALAKNGGFSLNDLLQMRQGDRLTVSECLHLMLLFGADVEVVRDGERTRLLEALTLEVVGATILTHPSLAKTATAIRVVEGPEERAPGAASPHRDHLLGVFAEVGVPLEQPVVVNGQRHTLQTLLDESVATLDVERDVIAWTTVAFLKYMPDQSRWVNRQGVRYSLDDLAKRLLGENIGLAPCGGAHEVSALSHLLRHSYEHRAALTDATRESVEKLLGRYVAAAEASQFADGTWDYGWHIPPRSAGSPRTSSAFQSDQLLLTGHIVQWLDSLPDRLRPSQGTLASAKRWLRDWRRNLTVAQYRRAYCPSTHGILSLRE